MTVEIKHWKQLSKDELYDLLQLRIEVFVVEQDCPYQEADGIDKNAWHVLGAIDSKIMGTARIYEKSTCWAIGRVVVSEGHRGKDFGRQIMLDAIQFVRGKSECIEISAQDHLRKFYSELGFEAFGEVYLEDGIPHVGMKLSI